VTNSQNRTSASNETLLTTILHCNIYLAFYILYRKNRAVYFVEMCTVDVTHTHTHPFNGPLSGTTRVSRYQKGKTSLDFTGAKDSEWQWHQLGHMQVCT